MFLVKLDKGVQQGDTNKNGTQISLRQLLITGSNLSEQYTYIRKIALEIDRQENVVENTSQNQEQVEVLDDTVEIL